MADITILHSSKINKTKWDACIATNGNGLIYATSIFLDTMCTNWFGLVVNNYETIVPITIKQKFGFSYYYMPAFVQQLGIIGNQNYYSEIKNEILNFVKYGSPYLNFSNSLFAQKENCTALSNFILSLNKPYQQIKSAYKKSINYSLSKAAKINFTYSHSHNISEAIQLYKQYNKHKMQHVNNADYKNLETLLNKLQQTQQVLIRKVHSPTNNLQSIVLLIKDNKRYYNILNYTTPDGKKNEANYFLYNMLLQELCGSNMIFDFEGSDLKGVKQFYEKFGATNQPYFHWHFNNLPKLFQLFKK